MTENSQRLEEDSEKGQVQQTAAMSRQPCNTQIRQHPVESHLNLKYSVTLKTAIKAGKKKLQEWEGIYPFKKVVDKKHLKDLTELAGLIYDERLDILTSERLSAATVGG